MDVPEKLIFSENKATKIVAIRPFFGQPSRDKRSIALVESLTGVPHTIIDNTPITGFKMVGYGKPRKGSGWVDLVDPRGVKVSLGIDSFYNLCKDVKIEGGVIQDECVYLSNMDIVPVKSQFIKSVDTFNSAVSEYKEFLKSKRVTLKKSKSFDSVLKYQLPLYDKKTQQGSLYHFKFVYIKKLKVIFDINEWAFRGKGVKLGTFERVFEDCLLHYSTGGSIKLNVNQKSSGWTSTDIAFDKSEQWKLTVVGLDIDNEDELEYALVNKVKNITSYDIDRIIREEKDSSKLNTKVQSISVVE